VSAFPFASYFSRFALSPLASWELPPWLLTTRASTIVTDLLATLPPGYQIADGVAVHGTARVERGALLKGPLIVGPRCFIAAGALVRGGNWLDEDCVLGPGCELKSSFLFRAARLAHFNFVGDSLLGEDVNLEAGSLLCNYWNEREDKRIHVLVAGERQATGAEKFGSLVGDGCRIGANAVLAPGTVLASRSVVGRTQLIDQDAVPAAAPPR
jgi:NDP-sugar pyrophosphorylase family protein